MSSKEFTAKTFKWLYQVNWDANLLPVDVKVAVQLTWHFNEDDKDGRAYPSYKYIGGAIGLSEKTVRHSARRLHKHGHLRVVWGAPGRGQSNQYWMVLKTEKTGTIQPVSTSQKTSTTKPVLEEERASRARKTGVWGRENGHSYAREPQKEPPGEPHACAPPPLGVKGFGHQPTPEAI